MKQSTYPVSQYEDKVLSYLNFAVREYIKLSRQPHLHYLTNEVVNSYVDNAAVIEGIISGLYINGRNVFGNSSIPWTYEVFIS